MIRTNPTAIVTFAGKITVTAGGDDLHGRFDSRRDESEPSPDRECRDNDDDWGDDNGWKPDNGWDDDEDDWHDERGNGRGGECYDCLDDSDEGDWEDEAKLYRDFLDNLHSCQVECSNEAAVVVRREFRRLADAIVDGFYTAGSSEEVVTEGRIRWRGVELDWSIYCFDRTELYGWNELGYPEDFMLRLFVITAKEADFNDRLAEEERARWCP